MLRLFACLLAIPSLCCSPKWALGADKPDPKLNVFHAEIEVVIQREQLAKYVISRADVERALTDLYSKGQQFTLSDVKALKIRNREGTEVELWRLATIDVKFSKAPTSTEKERRPSPVKPTVPN
jgi:hypothetical protein